MVEEKRKLYKRISKKALEDAELTMMKEERFGLYGEREEKKKHQHRYEREKRREKSERYPDGEVEEDYNRHSYSSNEKYRHKPCRSHHNHHTSTTLEDERMRKKKEESLLEEIDALDATIGKI